MEPLPSYTKYVKYKEIPSKYKLFPFKCMSDNILKYFQCLQMGSLAPYSKYVKYKEIPAYKYFFGGLFVFR
jgi:hypothetical protein